MKKMFITCILALTSTFAFADQCQLVTKEQAKQAVRVLMDAQTVQAFCEPCGETKPYDITVSSITLMDANYEGTWEVFVNGMSRDLAYTYVNGMNLSKIVGCESDSVSPSLLK